MNKNLKQKGFTLIELLLYVGVSSTILLASTLFLSTLLESRIKNQTIAEVEQQGIQVMQIITQTIRNSENINSPTTGLSAPILSLDVVNVQKDPTIFDIASSSIYIKEGNGSGLALTNSRVSVSALNFQNLSRANTSGLLRISFTISRKNSVGRQEYNYSKTFYGSAALRQP